MRKLSFWCWVCLLISFLLIITIVSADNSSIVPNISPRANLTKPHNSIFTKSTPFQRLIILNTPQPSTANPNENKPDLVVSKFEIVNGNPNTSESFYIRIEVKNQGQTIATFPANSTYCEYTYPGSTTPRKLRYTQSSSIAPGQTVADGFSISPGDCPVGTYTLVAKADPEGKIAETNETNNQKTFMFNLVQGGKPDLVISDIRVTLPTGTSGTYTFWTTIKNQGNGPAYTSSGSLIVSCPEIGYTYPGNTVIFPNETKVFAIQRTSIPPGNYNFVFTVDPQNKITEADETNNGRQFQLQVAAAAGVTGQPDLIVSKFEIVNGNPNTSESFYIRIEVKNQGQAIATFPANSTYCEYTYPGNTTPRKLRFTQSSSIVPGQIVADGFTISPGDCPVGTYTLVAKADPEGKIAETNETNNEKTYMFNLVQGGKPDLVISDIRVTLPTGTSGTYTFWTTIKNQGNGPAYTSSGSLIVSCPEIGYTYPGNTVIFPNETKVFAIQRASIPPGNYNFVFTVDPQNKIVEADETNNGRVFQLQVN